MIKLFNINHYTIDTSTFKHVLHDYETQLEEEFAEYVGAKYACAANSATSLIYLSLKQWTTPNEIINLPSIIPPVVPNVVNNAGRLIRWVDNVDWVGHSYLLHDGDTKIVDSAQEVTRNSFFSDGEIRIYSFYPTKPVGSIDGGIVVSNCKEKIDWFKAAVHNGANQNDNSWDRMILFPGWKMYINSVQAYIALQNLRRLRYKNQTLQEIRTQYNNAFGKDNTSLHLYRLNVSNRQDFIKNMTDNGIQCGIHYHAAHHNSCYTTSHTGNNLTCSNWKSQTTVSIPFHEELTGDMINKVIEKAHIYAKIETD
jgi:dTDP-4-amino-4,6-dideoxygalactose transaminase